MSRDMVNSNDILSQLLDTVERVDFQEVAELSEGEKLSKRHFSIITIDKLLETAKKRKWGICTKNGFIYIYNSAYWEAIDKEDFAGFLGKVAEKMGVYKFDAKHHIFRIELFKQFCATANLPTPKIEEGVTLINLKNGTFEISESGQRLRDPSPQDFIKYQLHFDYDLDAKAPTFEKFLNRVLPDKRCQDVLAEFIGYIFTTSIKLEKALILFGSGANGKSVFYEVITAMLGSQNVCSYSLENLTKSDSYQRAELSNKLVNYASEINGKLEASIFKQLTSGEPVEARQIYSTPFMMTNYAKLIFNCNELPREVEQTNAFFRRFVIVPFNVTIPEEEQDIHLAQRIIGSELSGVFNWVLDGLSRLLENGGLTQSDLIKEQIDNYRRESDSVQMFIEENGYIPSTNTYKKRQELYVEYSSYARDNGYKAVSNKTFGDRIGRLGFEMERKNYGRVVWWQQDYNFYYKENADEEDNYSF